MVSNSLDIVYASLPTALRSIASRLRKNAGKYPHENSVQRTRNQMQPGILLHLRKLVSNASPVCISFPFLFLYSPFFYFRRFFINFGVDGCLLGSTTLSLVQLDGGAYCVSFCFPHPIPRCIIARRKSVGPVNRYSTARKTNWGSS